MGAFAREQVLPNTEAPVPADLVRRSPLLAALPDADLEALAERLRLSRYPAGSALFAEGEFGDRLYIVVEGQVAIIKSHGTADERLIDIRTTGDFLGEMSLLHPDRLRTASARVVSDAAALELTSADFDMLLRRHPSLAHEMLKTISWQLREANNRTIRDLREKNSRLEQAYAEIQLAQVQLIEQERLAREMQLARSIQESMLPASLPRLPWLDLGARMVPAHAIGGDFYDVFQVDDDTLGVVVADVCDKGVPAALYAAQSRSLLRAEAARLREPDEVLRRVNRLLLDLTATDGMFVTMLYGLLSHRTGEFAYARAGHMRPLGWDASGQLLPFVHGIGHPLGLLDEPAIDVQRIVLTPGATVLLYTDGATESPGPDGVFFDLERLAAIRPDGMHAQRLCDVIVRAVADHRGPAPQADDLTLVALRALG